MLRLLETYCTKFGAEERKVKKMKKDKIVFENFGEKYVKEAVELALKEFEAEKKMCPNLPEDNIKESLTGLLTWLCGQPYGKVLLYQEKVVGFLVFAGPWDELHGKEKGVFSPLGGSAFEEVPGIKREKLASLLLSAVAEELAQDGIFSCAVSRYAHDEEVGRSFVLNGFGIRCSDAIMDIAKEGFSEKSTEEVQFEELRPEDFKKVASLRNGLILHMCKAPILFPTDLDGYEDWFCKKMRVFVAKVQGEIVGFISVDDEGENFITGDEKMANICGAFFKEEFRGNGMAEALLSHVCNIFRMEGMKNMGVDFETLNSTAIHFWSKYFTSYTYSYARRFDERIRGYEEEAKRFFMEL